MKYPKDSYITSRGCRRKILEVLGDLRFISAPVDNGHPESLVGFYSMVSELEYNGWIEEPVKWEPAKDEKYYCIEDGLISDWHYWGDDFTDNARKNGLGIYRTQEEAQAAVDKIKEFMKTIV